MEGDATIEAYVPTLYHTSARAVCPAKQWPAHPALAKRVPHTSVSCASVLCASSCSCCAKTGVGPP
eukprot:4290510-Prorocentrum_lima.AAC.1